MAKEQHTLGEWKVISHAPFSVWCGDTQIASCRWTVEAAKGKHVVSGVCEQHQDRAEANARLIAAAPDMLAALEVTRLYLREVIGVQEGGPLPQIDAAIAKASGKAVQR